MTPPAAVVFLIDVDNTLLDNDRLRDDMQVHLRGAFDAAGERYWAIQERLFVDLGYRDYLGALQVHRAEHPEDDPLFAMSGWLIDYPYADRLYPDAIALLRKLGAWGRTVILSDGDVVFQPRKIERAGLAAAASGGYLIYVHKEERLADVERRHPSDHYVLIDDKLRILTAAKRHWGTRVTTVFPRQGALANDARALAGLPAADVTVERIGELLAFELSDLLAGARSVATR